MKHVLFATFVAICWSAPAQAEDTHESLAEEGIKALNTFADILSSIKDKESGDKAKADLRKTAEKLNDLKMRVDRLGEPKGVRKEELEKKYKPKLEEVMKKVQGEMDRIAKKVDGGPTILADLNSVLEPTVKK